ncbi:MAG: branched-chain amino acid ABC transporter permease [Pseudomonadota bacterium]
MIIGNLKSNYAADEAILRSWPLRWGFWAAIAVALIAPQFMSGYQLYLTTQATVYLIALVGLNILTGYTGLVSLGHGAMVGVGAYTTAVLANTYGMPVFVTIPAAMLMTVAVGLLFGLPSLRIKGLYLTIATISASFIIVFVLETWESVTNGDSGITIPPANIFGIEIVSDQQKFYFILPFAIAAILFGQNLFRTRVGRAFIAIRDGELSAEIIGVNLMKYKLYSFAIASALAGLSGALFSYMFLAITPTLFELPISIQLLAALVIGGVASTLGPIFGAAFIVMVPEIVKGVLGLLSGGDMSWAEYTAPASTLVYGMLIIGFMLFESQGLVAIWRRFWRFVNLWPFRP